MREILAREAQEIELGKRGENLACRVVFDISTWQKEYGEGVVQLIHQRNGDKTPYPCVVAADGSNAYWNITSADVDVAGRGHCELQYWVDDAIVKSATYITRTARSMSPASDTAPEPQKAWVDSVIQAGIDAVESAASAEAAAASAEASAESLAESERNAAISEQAAKDAASNAAASQTAAADSEAKAKLYANQCEASVSGVASFNGRGGHVMPQAGDYTADMVVGAVSKSGDTMTGTLNLLDQYTRDKNTELFRWENMTLLRHYIDNDGHYHGFLIAPDHGGLLYQEQDGSGKPNYNIIHTGNKNLITASDVGAANRNLLDNWYFGNPVDQRGGYIVPTGTVCYNNTNLTTNVGTASAPRQITINGTNSDGVAYVGWVVDGLPYYAYASDAVRGYTGNVAYTIDRWKCGGNAPLVIENDAVKLNSTGQWAQWVQVFENYEALRGKTITFSVLVSEVSGNAVCLCIDDGAWHQKKIAGTGVTSFTYTISETATKLSLMVFPNYTGNADTTSYVKIVAAKLELGTQQTLAHTENGKWVLNEIPDKNEELLKCCRSTADSSDTYANNKVTPAAINAVNKAGDTMNGVFYIRPIGATGYSQLYKNETSGGDWGTLLLDRDAANAMCGLKLRAAYKQARITDGSSEFDILHTGNTPNVCNFIAGSYVGTGTVGVDGKNEITFPFEPKYVVVYQATGWNSVAFTFINPVKTINAGLPASSPQFSPTAEWSGKTLRWYLTGSLLNGGTEPQAGHQANTSGTTYYYAAWG